MLELLFPKKRGNRERFELKKGVGWQFCTFPEQVKGYDAYFKDGIFVVTNEFLTFRAFDDCNVIYEVNLPAVEKRKISFEVSYRKPLFQNSPLKKYENENREIDMAAFLKTEPQGRLFVCEYKEKSEDEAPYTETLEMELDRSSNVLRFYLTVTYRSEGKEKTQEQGSALQKDNLIKVINNELVLDYSGQFMEVMKKVMSYCEKRELPISVRCEDNMWPGCDFIIPCTVIKTDHFELAFEFESLDSVRVAEGILLDTKWKCLPES